MSKQNSGVKPQKQGIWKPFLRLIQEAKMPWLFIILKMIISLGQSQILLMFPDATQNVLAGDISASAIAFVIAILFGEAIVTSVSQFVGTVTRTKITLSLRKLMVRKTLRLPVPFYDKNMADRLISRTTQDTTLLSDFMGDSLPGLPGNIYRVIGTFVILFTYDWRLVLLELIMIPVVIAMAALSGRVNYKWNRKLQAKLAELTGYLSEALSNIPLIKVFVKEDKENEKGQKNIDELYKTKKKYLGIGSLVAFLTSTQSLIQTAICVVGGVYLIKGDMITIDEWIAFYLYSEGLLSTFGTLTTKWDVMKTAQGAVQRLSEICVEAEEDQGGELTLDQSTGNLCFDSVSFGYSDELILRDLSFEIPRNKVTALVGKSGVGKSTVFGLLERFYVPGSGTIRMGSQDVREFDLSDWRNSIGYVPQDGLLFSGTIRSNITYGIDREVSEEELISAAKNANAYDFVMGLENGFETEVGERGSKLSGGQRQRIAIARALLKDPKILLLDEATSSLDAEAAHEVEQALDRLKEGRTTIIIAHDLASIQNADQIIVLNDKSVAGCGTHKELVASSPLYRSLLEMQGIPCQVQ